MTTFAEQRFVEAQFNGQRIFVRVKSEKGDIVIGTRVRKDGSDFERVTKTHVQVFVTVFKKSDIIREMRMSLHYAMLVPADQPARPDTADAEEIP